ncbi:hypothetical protein A2334_02340 [Candidatus Roizmanbacteria bacterium RIFOXYB2_FULL_38_10]|uniref:L-threonylcarbamoyladenylate synthase n=1 Tax=Candidatus Roizmanbacteria bacterium RIFOXYD1_FULL_38_12 TaxID=1802093 RepID=A0A1F7L032_9BACT|nr:MAG: hypothetical protein A3K47_01630 [Candidatus Roizmanbacteria bacterium RIFOXYA2_FULL_38_14]OGK63484.1 MAG: hypothetical protein A3K27_01630 [Candidatus Roizmanbacteria bacterium RIFOXYA1_FULL_37_12]OGK65330.1 MAG: hypothetical protein A3K38_01630 [Candidatus Roizmanbacteria bacterium RIFOXYB1_FULL_40_23]OGK67956.1 MAG: hypothetical protein A2334_02340 [Candidatus Roizmanbacteria bacterium RIFOXYB2_FULL_38_10]OGK69735.1 MAG: hypothetical protein A3K21_01635 [Candidatus Roizmanbacteria ba
MKILHLNNKAIEEAKKVLKNGELVIFPSDTVYAALVDATSSQAVNKLIAFKNRPPGKPISFFVSNFKMMKDYVKMDSKQNALIHTILPGPFTVILKANKKVVSGLESEKGAVGIRIPHYDPVLRLVEKMNRPITATSANLSGRSPHYSIKTLLQELPKIKKDMIDLIVDAGHLPRNKPSTVIDLTSSSFKTLRQGDMKMKNNETFISRGTRETEKIAQFIFNKTLVQGTDKPLIYILEGEMGVGKTIFVKGVGALLDINNIISPTFVVSYEYTVHKEGVNKLIHCDFFNIEDEEEFEYLGFEHNLKPRTIFFIEWGERGGKLKALLQKRAKVIYIKMKYKKDNIREISLNL